MGDGLSKKKNDKKECLICNKSYSLSNFYNTNNVFFPDGKIHVCKKCVYEKIEEHGVNALKQFLKIIDKPFKKELWNGNYREYIKKIMLAQSYSHTYDDSTIFNADVKNEDDNLLNKLQNKVDITDEMRIRWRGFNDEDILILEDYYQRLISTYENNTPIQDNLYRNIAITQLKADKAIAQGHTNEYGKLMNVLSTLMNDAKLKPVQETEALSGKSTFGELIKMIEEEEPIPEPKEEFKDVDGIRKYIDRWFVKHFARVFGLNSDNDFDNEILLEPNTGEKNE